MLEIYTDGACRDNGKPDAQASWGFVVVGDNPVKSSGRVDEYTKQTNNTGELTAIAEAILFAISKDHESVLIYSDSRYCIDSLTIWNIEKKKKGEKKANYDLIKEILGLMEQIDVSFAWVKGHSDHYWNDKADYLANNVLGL